MRMLPRSPLFVKMCRKEHTTEVDVHYFGTLSSKDLSDVAFFVIAGPSPYLVIPSSPMLNFLPGALHVPTWLDKQFTPSTAEDRPKRACV